MLTKHTVIYAAREPFPLECDIYESLDWKSPNNSPAILFFHAGGMVAGARQCVPPWLVQVCPLSFGLVLRIQMIG